MPPELFTPVEDADVAAQTIESALVSGLCGGEGITTIHTADGRLFDPARESLLHELKWWRRHAKSALIQLPAPTPRRESRDLDIEEWQPPSGTIGAKTIGVNYGVPRTTLFDWESHDKPTVVADPKTREKYFPRQWVEDRMSRWHKGKTTPIAER